MHAEVASPSAPASASAPASDLNPNPIHWSLKEGGRPQSKEQLLARMREERTLWADSQDPKTRRQCSMLDSMCAFVEGAQNVNHIEAHKITLLLLEHSDRPQIERRKDMLDLVSRLYSLGIVNAQKAYQLMCALIGATNNEAFQALSSKHQTFVTMIRNNDLQTSSDYVDACRRMMGRESSKPTVEQTDREQTITIFHRATSRLVEDNRICHLLFQAALFSLVDEAGTYHFAQCLAISAALRSHHPEVNMWLVASRPRPVPVQ